MVRGMVNQGVFRYTIGDVHEGVIRTIRDMAEEFVDLLTVMCAKGISRMVLCMAEECIDVLTAL